MRNKQHRNTQPETLRSTQQPRTKKTARAATRQTTAQLQSFESVIVIVIVMFIVILGILFFARMGRETINEESRKKADVDAITLFSLVTNLPELQCSKYGGVTDPACINLYKAKALSKLIKKEGERSVKSPAFFYYNALFGDATVSLATIYPNEENITLYDRKPRHTTRSIPIRIPIKVEDPITNKKAFGVLTVTHHT